MGQLDKLRVLSFNTWGMPLASHDLQFRLDKLAEYLRTDGKQLDLVLLQEVWTDALVELLAGAGGQAGLSYCRTFDGGLFGAGLMLLSRFPIVDMAFHAFSIKGEPGALQGEALAGKGIAYARVQLPDGTSAHVFNTHTHANWVHSTAPDALYPEVRIPTDSFAPYRTAHIVDAISFMRRTVEAASAAEELVIAGGDWNVPVDNMEMVLLVEMLPQLTDAWQAAGHGAMDPRGNTCGAPENKYTGSIIGGYVPERIDFVWTNCQVAACDTVLARIPGSDLFYSDHYGVLATLVPVVSKPALRCQPLITACSVDNSHNHDKQHQQHGVTSPGRRRQLGAATAAAVSEGTLCPSGPVAEARVSPCSGTASEPGSPAGADAQVVAADGKSSLGSHKREQLLAVSLQLLRTGLACSTARMTKCRRIAAVCVVVSVLASVLQLYVIISSNGQLPLRICGAIAVALPILAGPCAMYMVVLSCMDRTGQRSYGQLIRTVEVWLEAAKRDGQGAGKLGNASRVKQV